jgi:hypothetical protein
LVTILITPLTAFARTLHFVVLLHKQEKPVKIRICEHRRSMYRRRLLIEPSHTFGGVGNGKEFTLQLPIAGRAAKSHA